MNKIDLIISKIEAAQRAWHPVASETLIEEALAAARELRALKPVAWVTRRSGDGGCVLDGFETCDSDDYGAIPVYALDEVTK
jgi:hypothetical protein